jgi:hypothetical protein
MRDLSFIAYYQQRITESQFATSETDREGLRLIINKLIQGDMAWFKQNHFLVGDKGNHWILNYSVEGKNEYNRLTRGLVVRKPQPGFNGDPLSLISSFPFIRFFNQGELQADPVDFRNAEMLEKLDGTMVAVHFPTGNPAQPHYHTRRMTSGSDRDMNNTIKSFGGKTFNLMKLIGEYVKHARFSQGDEIYTFVFEFLHEATAVVTRYQPAQYGLYLLGARNLQTHSELSEDELDAVAQRIGVRRPRRFSAVADQTEIARMFKLAGEETPDFEGFIFRDKNTGKRVKVKDPDYVKKHHLIDEVSYKRLMPLWMEGEADEVIAYLPNGLKELAQQLVADIEEAYKAYLDKATAQVMEWAKKGLNQSELSTAIFGRPTHNLKPWEIKLKKMRGEPVPEQPERAIEDEFIRSMVLKYSKFLDSDLIRDKINTAMREVAIGKGGRKIVDEFGRERYASGNPGKLVDMIGLEEKEDLIPDIGEL